MVKIYHTLITFIRLKGHQMCTGEVFQNTYTYFNLLFSEAPLVPLLLPFLLSVLAETLLVCVVLHLLRINKRVIINNRGDTSFQMVETIQ